ncbi:Histidinol-phosphatase [Corynebacterium glaucum]|uniref:Histidinol-phosphatase n=1 Tax=Corynebacterium glaucum TaxID=187491 RepID=A0A1Q2HUU5_9CORY|nr:histidinol-phosphatase [Corynebacterium glaucum]AQQ14617.1 Histidinol-phosphatase [Corynebacterium glaucum]WJZ07145.1 Histidinol-phosphatase [Corynebacterium glaucum]
MTSPNYSDDLALALELTDLADSITLDRFEAADLKIESKPDLTPVSDADLAVEEALRARLTEARPADAVLGEEFGGEAAFEGRQWVIDPIDGTKNFVRGVPVWATLVALLIDGSPVVGVVSAPALARRWYASSGAGAWRTFGGQGLKRLSVSGVAEVEDASLSMSSLSGWTDRGLRDNFLGLAEQTWRLRGYGDFFSYCLVAEGAVDIAAEPEVSLWDLAPLVLLVEEAGGKFTSLTGEDGPHGGDALATNGLLHEAALAQIAAPGA